MTSRKTFAAAGVAALLCLGPGVAVAHGSGFGGVDGSAPYGWHYGWHPGWHMGPEMMMQGCPMGSGYGMGGPGMMGPGMMGPGMMGQGMMMGPGYGPDGDGMPMMGPGMQRQGMGQGMGPGMGQGMMQPSPRTLSADDVKTMLERHLAWQGNPHVKLGAVEEKNEDTILAEIVTQDGSLVERLEVDRHSGWTRMVP